MSDGPRDAARWFGGTEPVKPALHSNTVVGLSITKADAGRILSRYRGIPIGEIDENELDLVLKLKRFVETS